MKIITQTKLTKDCFKDFGYRNSCLDTWLPKEQPARAGEVSVHVFSERLTFKEMAKKFLGTDALDVVKQHCLTLPMVEEMIVNHSDQLNQDGYINFFFVENEDDSVSVARVSRHAGDRRWRADVYEFAYDDRWYAGHRLVVCNLDTQTLESSDPIKLTVSTYTHRTTGITFTKKEDGTVTIFNKGSKKEFVFQDSTKETLEKIGQALIDISRV